MQLTFFTKKVKIRRMTILFSSSSFLPDSIMYWKKIRNETSCLDFSEYGNIVHSLVNLKNYDSFIAIIFFVERDKLIIFRVNT